METELVNKLWGLRYQIMQTNNLHIHKENYQNFTSVHFTTSTTNAFSQVPKIKQRRAQPFEAAALWFDQPKKIVLFFKFAIFGSGKWNIPLNTQFKIPSDKTTPLILP